MSDQASFSSPLPGSGADVVPPSSLESAGCCEEHKECLSLFCLDDLEPLCKQCAADSHAHHRVYLLAEAAIDCKEELKTSLSGLNMKLQKFEDVLQMCKKESKRIQTDSKLCEETLKEEIAKLHQFLRQEKASRLHALMEDMEEKTRKVEERINRLTEVITPLEEKIQLTERELHEEGDGYEYLQVYNNAMSSTWSDNMKPERIHRPLINVAKHLGNLRYAVWEKMKQIAPYTPVILDSRTAGEVVRVSSELNSFHITSGPSQRADQHINETIPTNPEHFHPQTCILARDGFNTGVHCWDIEVGDTSSWRVGVAASFMLTKTKHEARPEAGLWCISLKDGEYRVLTTPTQTLDLGNSHHLTRVHVRLDCEGGTLEFIDADADASLYTFTHCCTETVYPYFECRSLVGSVAVLEQTVEIGVASHYLPLKDTVTVLEDQTTNGNSPTKKDTAANVMREMDVEHLIWAKKSREMCSSEEVKIAKAKEKEETTNIIKSGGKRSRMSRLNINYHVSLSQTLNNTVTDCGNLK